MIHISIEVSAKLMACHKIIIGKLYSLLVNFKIVITTFLALTILSRSFKLIPVRTILPSLFIINLQTLLKLHLIANDFTDHKIMHDGTAPTAMRCPFKPQTCTINDILQEYPTHDGV